MKITRKEKRDTIQHYWRMWEWVRTQDPVKSTSFTAITKAINENWSSKFCPLCSGYYDLSTAQGCSDCPLHEIGEGCIYDNSLWDKLDCSLTWAEWLKNAELMIEVFMQLEVRE